VVLPGAGWAILQVLLVMMLVTILGGIFAAARFRRRVRDHWQAHQEFRGDQGWGGPGDDEPGDDEPGGSWGWPAGHWQHHARYWAGPATPPSSAR
jgi:hypothetical protein